MRHLKSVLFVSSLSVLAACDREPRPDPAPTGSAATASAPSASASTTAAAAPRAKETKPLEVTWSEVHGQKKGAIAGGGSLETTALEKGYHVTFRGVPKGTRWKLGDNAGTVDYDYASASLALKDRLGPVKLGDLESFDPAAELELELPDGRAGKVKLPPVNLTYMVDELLSKVQNGGPVLFGEEADDPNKADSLVWPKQFGDDRIFGKAKTVQEIDLVLVVNELPDEKGRKTCGGYKDNAGKAVEDVTLILKENEAVVHDRRTGDVVARKVFPPDAKCPMFAFTSGGSNTTESLPPTRAIASWARTQLKK